MSRFLPRLLASLTVLSLSLTGLAIAPVLFVPDSAYAKNEESNRDGKKNERGAERGKRDDKADRGRANGAGKANHNSSSERSRSAAKNPGSGTGKGQPKSKNHTSGWPRSAAKKQNQPATVSSRSSDGPKTLSELGQSMRSDFSRLLGDEGTPKRGARPARKSAPEVKKSPRPVMRDPSKRRRPDPLVLAITDPEGSDNLRNLNAAKAASPAFENAAANSNVGRIATYQRAAEDYYALRAEQRETLSKIKKLDASYDGRSSAEILKDLEDLDPAAPDYNEAFAQLSEELAAAGVYEAKRERLTDSAAAGSKEVKRAATVAEDAFFAASKDRTLTPDALNDLHAELGLPAANRGAVGPKPKLDGAPEATRRDPAQAADRGDRPAPGAVNQELKNLNAASASPQAFRNAEPGSQVGRLAAYEASASAFYDLRVKLQESQRRLERLDETYSGRSSDEILSEIKALDPEGPEFEDQLADLKSELKEARVYEGLRDNLITKIDSTQAELPGALKSARAAFLDASNGRRISREAMAELHLMLGLPEPIGRPRETPLDGAEAELARLAAD